MGTVKNIYFWVVFIFISVAALNAHASVVNYTLDDVFLVDGTQMTGTFEWTYADGDFENGVGQFSTLDIPWTVAPLDEEGLVVTIESGSIEISLDGDFHDYGLDINLKFLQVFSPTQSSFVNTGLSKFECCGNGFHDGLFESGSISPTVSAVPLPAAFPLFLSAIAVFGFVARRRRSRGSLATA